MYICTLYVVVHTTCNADLRQVIRQFSSNDLADVSRSSDFAKVACLVQSSTLDETAEDEEDEESMKAALMSSSK